MMDEPIYQRQAGADGVDFRYAEHNQAPGYQEAAAHAKEPAQGAYNDAQQDQQHGIYHHVGIGKEHSRA